MVNSLAEALKTAGGQGTPGEFWALCCGCMQSWIACCFPLLYYSYKEQQSWSLMSLLEGTDWMKLYPFRNLYVPDLFLRIGKNSTECR